MDEINETTDRIDVSEITDEFADVSFGDKRINDRAIKLLTDLYSHVGGGLSRSCQGPAEIKAAYRYFDNPKVTMHKILQPHFKATLERIKTQKIVALSQDTTDADMKHMTTVEDLGVLNDTDRPGCSLHPVIAFTPDQLCLGVVHTEVMIRDAKDLGKKPDKKNRAFEDKETHRWLKGYHVACEIAQKCSNTLCVSIGDRENDIYEVLIAAQPNAESGKKAELLVRAWHNRAVVVSDDEQLSENHKLLIEENQKLNQIKHELKNRNKKIIKRVKIANLSEEERVEFNSNKLEIAENNKKIKENNSVLNADRKLVKSLNYQMAKAEIVGDVEFVLSEGRGRKSRLVKQNIRTATLTIPPPVHKKHLPNITINAVFLEELNSPEGASPINWLLLTTLPVDTLEDATLVVKLYLSRWGIELFFKVLKSGCKIEKLRFEKANRLLPCIAMFMIVAWRVMYATYLGRECPNAPCSLLYDDDEWRSVFAVVTKSQPPEEPPNLSDFTKMVASLGGYRGRKSDGSPGIQAMWIGIQAMHRMAAGWSAHEKFGNAPSKSSGSKMSTIKRDIS